MNRVEKIFSEIRPWYLIVPFVILTLIAIFLEPSFQVPYGKEEKKLLNMIESIPEGSKVLVAVNYTPQTRYELDGSFHLIVRELLSRKVGIVFMTLTEMGIETISMGVRESLSGISSQEWSAVYGKDYVNIGYFAGGTLAAGAVSGSIFSMRGSDVFGNDLKNMSVMNGVDSFSDFSAFIELSSMKIDGTPAAVLFNVLSKGEGTPVIAVVTSDMVPEYIPFRKSGRIDILIKGSRRMAALERAFNNPGISTVRYSIASVLLVFIIFMIILSNIKNLVTGRK